jgi:hypothetical protein
MILDGIVFVLLSLIIIFEVHSPVQSTLVYAGAFVVSVTLLVYNPLLGVLAIIASYVFVDKPGPRFVAPAQDYGEQAPIVGPSHFSDTLEVYMVKHMTPMAQTKPLPMLSTENDTHDAASAS